jgi:hypothetical protein
MQTRFTEAELMARHPYVRSADEAGRRLHGGIDAEGRYQTPRTLDRWRAVQAWSARLSARGAQLLDISTDILKERIYPNLHQQEVLLRAGCGQVLWNALSTTGILEARAGLLARMTAPDFSAIVVEPLGDLAAGHLNRGLLRAHGMDEAGDPDHPAVGGHDAMWFAIRDLAFGAGAYPLPEPPISGSRPTRREMVEIPGENEQIIKVLMNALMLEVRAQAFFEYCQKLLRNPANFPGRHEEATAACRIVDRIAQDEQIHIAYLNVFLSELRASTFRTIDGGETRGSAILDPVWDKMIEWHANSEIKSAASRRENAEAQIRESMGPAAQDLLERFEALQAVGASCAVSA